MPSINLYIYIAVLIVNILLGAIRFKHLSIAMRILFLLVFSTLMNTIISEAVSYDDYYLVIHTFLPLHFMLNCAIYLKLIRSIITKKAIFFVGILFTIFCIINPIYIQKTNQFPKNALLIECFLLTAMSCIYFYQMLDEIKREKIIHQSTFWFNSAMMQFYSAGFIVYSLHSYLERTNKTLLINLYSFIWFTDVIMHLLFVIAISIDRKKEYVKIRY